MLVSALDPTRRKYPVTWNLNRAKRSRYAAGEIRFRTSDADRDRLNFLLMHYPEHTISSLIRILIVREYERLQPKTE